MPAGGPVQRSLIPRYNQRDINAGRPRRGPMSLAVGETHGNDAPDKFTTPQGLNLVCRRNKRFDPSRVGNPLGLAFPSVGFTHGY